MNSPNITAPNPCFPLPMASSEIGLPPTVINEPGKRVCAIPLMKGSVDIVAVYLDEPRLRTTAAPGVGFEIGITVPATKIAVAEGIKLTSVPEIIFASPPASRVWSWRTMKGFGVAANWLLLVPITKFELKGIVYADEPRVKAIVGVALGGKLLTFGI